jgi:predicted nucleic acid-binding protein
VALLYLDTSAFVKLYVEERGSERMLELAHPDAGHRLTILALTCVEFRAALRRRVHLGDLDDSLASVLLEQMKAHLESIFVVQPMTDAVLDAASAVVDRHTLRANDALQLGGGLVVRQSAGDSEFWFVTSDHDLIEPAAAEGLHVVDPTD